MLARIKRVAGSRYAQLTATTGVLVAVPASNALALDPTDATDVDYSAATDGIVAGVAHALPYALTAMGVIAAFSIGIGIFRKVTGAKKAPNA